MARRQTQPMPDSQAGAREEVGDADEKGCRVGGHVGGIWIKEVIAEECVFVVA